MIHPSTALRFIDDAIGHGVFATAFIPKGTLTWVMDRLDREFSPEEVAGFDSAHRQILDHYCYRDARGHYVLCWDHARFMNHSFNPNCLLTPYRVEIAIRDIRADEELTNDYGLFNIIEPFTPHDEDQDRKIVGPDDLLRHAEHWDDQIGAAMRLLTNVEQPLSRFMSSKAWGRLLGVSRGEIPASSVASLSFPAL